MKLAQGQGLVLLFLIHEASPLGFQVVKTQPLNYIFPNGKNPLFGSLSYLVIITPTMVSCRYAASVSKHLPTFDQKLQKKKKLSYLKVKYNCLNTKQQFHILYLNIQTT